MKPVLIIFSLVFLTTFIESWLRWRQLGRINAWRRDAFDWMLLWGGLCLITGGGSFLFP